MTPIYVATTNSGKIHDFSFFRDLTGTPVTVTALPNIGEVEPVDEIGETFEENAILKAVFYSQLSAELVIADDSGLEVDALNGEPGVHSARFAGLNATANQNNELLLRRMNGKHDRRAQFRCVLAIAREGKLLGTFDGSVFGEIITAARGNDGFGYDPLFLYQPGNKTFGEIPGREKLQISHRGIALRKLFAWIATVDPSKIGVGELG